MPFRHNSFILFTHPTVNTSHSSRMPMNTYHILHTRGSTTYMQHNNGFLTSRTRGSHTTDTRTTHREVSHMTRFIYLLTCRHNRENFRASFVPTIGRRKGDKGKCPYHFNGFLRHDRVHCAVPGSVEGTHRSLWVTHFSVFLAVWRFVT